MICAPRFRSTRAGALLSSLCLAEEGELGLMGIVVRSVALRSGMMHVQFGGNR